MKALVKVKNGEYGFSLRNIPVPEPGTCQALIRVKAVGICGTDVHIYKGEIDTNTPVVIGHEFSGIIEQTGAGTKWAKPGDRVVSRQRLTKTPIGTPISMICFSWSVRITPTHRMLRR